MIPMITTTRDNLRLQIRNSTASTAGLPAKFEIRNAHRSLPLAALTTRHPHRPGAVLILIVVSLALLMLMGFAYMQIAFTDRQASNEFESRADSVAGDVIGYVLGELTRDVFPTGGANRPEPYDYPTNAWSWGGGAGAGQFGVYDDLWLASTTPDFTIPANPVWPKITYLDYNTAERGFLSQWSQNWTTAPNDAGHTPGQFTAATPTILPVDSVFQANPADTNVALNPLTNALVDADGDGIPDSRWQYAPTRSYGDVDYVVAVRIIDNSSLININLATALTNDGIAVDVTDDKRPRGWFPTEVDASRLLSRALVTYTSTPATEWANVQTQWTNNFMRFTGMNSSAAPPVPLFHNGLTLTDWPTDYTAGNSRLTLWMELGRYYGYETRLFDRENDRTADSTERFRRFGADSEEELRFRGGLNNAKVTRPPYTAQIEGPIPLPLRANWPASSSTNNPYESHFRRVVDPTISPPPSYGPPPAAGTVLNLYAQWFQGGTDPDITNRRFPDVRKFLTTTSGASVLIAPQWSRNYADNTANNNLYPWFTDPRRLKYDLLRDRGGAFYNFANNDPIEEMGSRIFQAMSTRDTGGNTNQYLGVGTGAPPQTPIVEAALELALGMKAYRDDYTANGYRPPAGFIDPGGVFPIPTSYPRQARVGAAVDQIPAILGANKVYFALRPMPFIREVYLQAGYVDTDTDFDTQFDAWVLQPDSRALAIELGNPFDQAIPDTALNNRIQILIVQGGVAVTTFPLAGVPAMGAGERLILFSNAANPINEGGVGNDLPADLGLPGTANFTRFNLPNGSLLFNADNDVEVHLQVDVDGAGAYVTYDRFIVTGLQVATQYIHAPNAAQVTPDRHAQIGARRAGENLRFLSNRDAGLTTARDIVADNTYNTTADNVTFMQVDAKGITGDERLDALQLLVPGRPMFSVAEIGKVFMLGFFSDPANPNDGDLPQRLSGLDGVSGIMGDATGTTGLQFRRLFLDFTNRAVVPNSTGIPHAAMVLEQFTTLSPAHDDVNNSDSSPDATPDDDPPAAADLEQSEQFVQGTININTMPLHLLTLAAPLPESLNEIQDLMAAIVEYRDRPKLNPADLTPTRREQLVDAAWADRTKQRLNPGIAQLGELLMLKPPAAQVAGIPGRSSAASDQRVSMQRYALDGDTNFATSDITLYPLPEDTGISGRTVPDEAGTANDNRDAAQRLARYQFLSQIFTTRSDVFTAYIHVRGYRRGEFDRSPVEMARYIVVFDRSNVLSPTDSPRVLARVRIQ